MEAGRAPARRMHNVQAPPRERRWLAACTHQGKETGLLLDHAGYALMMHTFPPHPTTPHPTPPFGRPKFGLHRLPLEFLSWSRWLPYILRCGASRCCPVRVCFEILGFGVLESRTHYVIKGSCECEYGPGKCSSAHSGSVFIIR